MKPPERSPSRITQWCVVLVAALVVAISVVWGWRVQADPDVKLGAAPLVGAWRLRFGASLLPASLLAALVVWRGSALAQRLSYGRMVAASAVSTAAFTFLLAASDGLDHLLDPVVHPSEYWANLATTPALGRLLHEYATIEFLNAHSVHVKGHPPGFLLLLKALSGLGLGQPWVVGILSYLGVAAGVLAVLQTLRLFVGERTARGAAPFLVLAPYLVWAGTSADAFYSGLGATGVWLTAGSLRSQGARRAHLLAFAAGLTLGGLLFFTYGAAVFLGLPLLIGLAMSAGHWRRAAVSAAYATAGALLVVVAFRLAGFWWPTGLRLTRLYYWGGTAQFRPARYFALANIGAAIIAVGPAIVAGIGRLRDRRVWIVVASAMLCIAAADASQYSKGEVERIWLIFYPWLLPAAAALPHPRRWLAAQAVLAVGLQLTLKSKW